MATTPDISTLLRQQQMLQQMQNVTGQGTGAALMPSATKQFDDTGGGSQTTSTGVEPPAGGKKGGLLAAIMGDPAAMAKPRTAVSSNPLAQAQAGVQNIKQGLQQRIAGVLGGNAATASADATGATNIGLRNADPANAPTMRINTGGQPAAGPGMMLAPGTSGVVNVPSPNTQATMQALTQQRYYNPQNLQLLGQ